MGRGEALCVVDVNRLVGFRAAQVKGHAQCGFRFGDALNTANDILALAREFALKLRDDRVGVRGVELLEGAARGNRHADSNDSNRGDNHERKQHEHFEAEAH